MLKLLLDLPQRSIYYIDQDERPACFLIIDNKGGGILVNSPIYSSLLFSEINLLTSIKSIFLPSKFGAKSVNDWRKATDVKIISHENEAASIPIPIDFKINHKTKLTRTIDFVPMAGRTHGTCALFLKNIPGVLFLGPSLSIGKNHWPMLIQNEDDISFETRMFGILGLKDLKFEYVFTDDFDFNTSQYGKNAHIEVKNNIDLFFD